MKKWWLRTCAHLQKNISKICDFRFFSFDLCTDIILKQLNKIKQLFFFVFFTFHFSLLFPVLFPPLCFPIVVPVVLPRCTTPLLGRSPRANRCENWWLRTCAHLQKNISKICDFRFFCFDLCTGIILKQLNKIKNLNIFFHFSFYSVVSPVFFSRCASLLWSLLSYRVVHPTAAPQGLQRRPGTARFHFPPTRARALAQNAHPDSLHWDHRPGETPRGDTTGRHNGETCKTGKQNGKQNRKVISINVKSI